MPIAPPEYSEEPESAFYIEAMEVYDATQILTEEQREIALFWADDPGATSTPPGHSVSILTQILRLEDSSLGFATQAYAKLGIAVADAFIGCWHTKYVYNLIRPVTVIRQLVDNEWMPIVNTPPFPEYSSGHSVQTGAAAVVLADLFGDEYTFTDHTHDERGLAPRTFTSFSEMAQETAISRLYGGIHYRVAIELGIEQGQCIGSQINELQFLKEL
jgi:membrane-associated phospholipid phosphatase